MVQEERDQPCAVFVTESKEYVVHGRTCLRLRDRRTGRWEPVLPNRVLGAVPPPPEHYLCDTTEPRIGDRLCIQMGSRYVVSTPILAIERAQPQRGEPARASQRPNSRSRTSTPGP